MPSEINQRFIDWCVLEGHEVTPQLRSLIEGHAETPNGRRIIAQSYIEPARRRLHRALQSHQRARRLATIIETLIHIFPEGERFIPPLITLREVLIDLYGFLSPNYELVPESMTDGEITYERIQQVAAWQQQEVLRQPSAHSSRIIRALRDVGVRVQAVFTSESGVVIEVPLDVPVSLVEGGTYRDVIFSSGDQVAPEPEAYNGPRPTRFERLNLFDEELPNEASTQDPR